MRKGTKAVHTLVLATAALLGGVEATSPDGALRAATLDLAEPGLPADRPYTRYLATWTAPPDRRDDLAKAVSFWANSLSNRRRITPPRPVGDALLKIDLRDYGWDRPTREARLKRLEGQGIDFGAGDAKARARLLDPWEALARRDPYFRVTQAVGDPEVCKSWWQQLGTVPYPALVQRYKVVRGWLDPLVERSARELSRSALCVVRADWFLQETGFDRPLGLYSDFLMLPPKEADLYKVFGADVGFIGREQLAMGGAVLRSIVARHNRALELFPSLVGRDDKFIWRTYDTEDNLRGRNVLANFLGSLELDGREIIGTLPNGLHFYYLANAQGVQVGEVPTSLAFRKNTPGEDLTVYNAWTCVSCHSKGINDYTDVVASMALHPRVGLAAIAKGKDSADAEKVRAAVEDYYLSGLSATIRRHQQSYEAAVKDVNGLAGDRNAANFVGWVEDYTNGRIDLARAATEMGVAPDVAREILANSGDEDCLAIVAGQAIARDAWEDSFAEAMKSRTYDWEK